MRRIFFRELFCLLVLLSPALAHAHSMQEAGSFIGGFMHPLRGADHLLAMLSVGIISVLIGRWAILWVPGAFVTCMLLGAALGVFGVTLPHFELGIALSVLLLGAAIMLPRQFPIWITMCIVGIFGSMHGNAHGVEMPKMAVPVFYSLGFIITTVTIHMIGVGIGFIPILQHKNNLAMKYLGVAITGTGIFFVIDALVVKASL